MNKRGQARRQFCSSLLLLLLELKLEDSFLPHMSAIQAIKAFRIREFRGLQGHLQRFGPLPKPKPAPTASEPDVVAPISPHKKLPNPFLPRLNPKTGRWAPPKYSRRRQAELVKKAKESNTLHLLPPGPKLFAPAALAARLGAPMDFSVPVSKKQAIVWTKPVAWEGKLVEKVVPGADIGSRLYSGKKRMFKGHMWERVKEDKDKRKHVLMRDMQKRVTSYKEVCFRSRVSFLRRWSDIPSFLQYYHRRKPNPLKPPRSSKKAPKLPF